MKTFRKWDKKHMADDGCYMSKEAKSFVTAFRNYLKRSFPEAEIVGFKPNHYDTSGFIVIDGKCVYVSYSLFRAPWGYAVADFDKSDCLGGVLYRTAKNTRDYHGGANCFTSINRMAENIRQMFDRYDILVA